MPGESLRLDKSEDSVTPHAYISVPDAPLDHPSAFIRLDSVPDEPQPSKNFIQLPNSMGESSATSTSDLYEWRFQDVSDGESDESDFNAFKRLPIEVQNEFISGIIDNLIDFIATHKIQVETDLASSSDISVEENVHKIMQLDPNMSRKQIDELVERKILKIKFENMFNQEEEEEDDSPDFESAASLNFSRPLDDSVFGSVDSSFSKNPSYAFMDALQSGSVIDDWRIDK